MDSVIWCAGKRFNCNFETFDAELKYAQSHVKDLFVTYDKKSLEKDPNKWTMDYLNRQKVAVMLNFSKERLNHVKQVAVKVLSKKK